MNAASSSIAARAGVALGIVVTLFAGLLAAPAGADHGAPVDCPSSMPIDEVSRGLIGQGWTVSQGREPQPFTAKILGVLPDGLGPGRDLIVVDTSGPAIEEAGGVWFGMSGSPVYHQDRLIGAVAFGLSSGPSSIAGLTPAEDLLRLLNREGSGDGSGTSTQTARYPSRVKLTSEQLRALGIRATSSGEDAAFMQLKVPLSVSGLTARGLRMLGRKIAREGLPLIPYAGSSVGANSSPQTTSLGAGDNFAATLSVGDITQAAIGTTSIVCEGRAVSFGHRFAWSGPTELGANVADALVVVDDPNFGPYKLALVGPSAGSVDQDRLAGLRSLVGVMPSSISVTSSVVNADSGESRDGASEALADPALPATSFLHLFGNLDVTYDRVGEGSSEVTWTVTGTTSSGVPFEINRSNVFATRFDISRLSAIELQAYLFSVLENRFEDVDFSSVDVDASVKRERKTYRIKELLVSKDGVDYSDRYRIRARPGDTIFLRILLKASDSDNLITQDMTFTIPSDVKRDQYINIFGGSQNQLRWCFFEEYACRLRIPRSVKSFDEMVAYLEELPRNNDLVAQMRRRRVKATQTIELDRVVSGYEFLFIRLPDSEEGRARAVD